MPWKAAAWCCAGPPNAEERPLVKHVLEQIHAAFARRGHEGYGEGVSQLDHALQCGMFAERDGATPALVAAAFLHDIGHLLHDLPQNVADTGVDTQHESTGSAWLSRSCSSIRAWIFWSCVKSWMRWSYSSRKPANASSVVCPAPG